MKMFRVVELLAVSLSLSGCAYVTAIPAPPGSNVEGIRIYESKPILIVTETATTVSLVPNYNRAYALRFGAFLAKNTMDVTWEGGFIKEVKSDQDSTAFIDLLKQAVQTFGPALTGTGHATHEGGGATSRFGVYEFVFDDEGNLTGLRPLLRERDLGRRPPKPNVAVGVPPAPAGNPNTPVVR
jgi:hypothetical protein